MSSGPAGSSVGPCLKVVKAGDAARVSQSPVSQSPDWGKIPSTIYVLISSHFWEKKRLKARHTRQYSKTECYILPLNRYSEIEVDNNCLCLDMFQQGKYFLLWYWKEYSNTEVSIVLSQFRNCSQIAQQSLRFSEIIIIGATFKVKNLCFVCVLSKLPFFLTSNENKGPQKSALVS